MSALPEKIITIALIIFSAASCASRDADHRTAAVTKTEAAAIAEEAREIVTEAYSEINTEKELTGKMPELTVNGTPVTVEWEDNESVQALSELAEKQTLTLRMSMYGGFEQVGSLGKTLPRNDVQTTTSPGDIVLYSGNSIVVFYGSNSWSYTRLGKITGMTDSELAEMLGNGDVTLTIG